MHLRHVPALILALPPMLAAQQRGFSDPAREAKLGAVFPAVDRIMREFTEREHVPGAAWAIVLDDRVVHMGVTGLRDIATKKPVDSSSVFRIASMTKSFTAMAIMRLRDEGKLSLDDPAEKFVPELEGLKYPTSDSPKITIRHLLSHSTGFPEDNPWGDQQLSRTDPELAAMLRKGIPFSNAPGVAYEYSNYGFAILGRIVTRASGTPYNDYVSTHILKPLGMRSTTLSPAAVPAGRLAHGYRWEDEQWKEEPQLPDGVVRLDGRHAHVADATSAGTSWRSWAPGRRAMGRRPGPCAARRSARCSRSGGPTRRASSATRRDSS